MIEDSFLFIRVKNVPQQHVATCQPWQDIRAVAHSIRESDASATVVCDQKIPIGIISDADFRDLFANWRVGYQQLKAEDIMSSPLHRIDRNDYVFEAIYTMAKNDIHHLVMVDEDGFFAGVVSDTDILSVQTSTPLYFNRDIEACETIDELKTLNAGMRDIVQFALDSGASPRDAVRLISMFNDTITKRVITLLDRDKGVRLPDSAAFLVLGSEGRQEQTLRTDQDNAMVFRDDISDADVAQAAAFADELVEALDHIGVPKCPGNTMASNPMWRKTVSQWLEQVDGWINTPTPDNMVNYGMFQDFRAIHGDLSLEQALRGPVMEKTKANSLFLVRLAQNVCRFPPPLGWFDRFQLERSGEHKGKMNLKKAGIFAITAAVSLMAVDAGCWGGTTWDKIDCLRKSETLTDDESAEIYRAFTLLINLRLKHHLWLLEQGEEPSDYVVPSAHRAVLQNQLREGLRGVRRMIRILRERYQVDLISS